MPLKVVLSTEISTTGWERTHQVPLLEVYVLVMSVQVCSEAGTKRATLDLTDVLLFVNGTDVFAVGPCARTNLGATVCLTDDLIHRCFNR